MRFHEVVSAVIGLVRRGNREVLWVPTNVNLGNFLYHWLRAFKDQEAGLGDPRVDHTRNAALARSHP
ncbi:MAG: hypothetical protein V9E81_03445 [Marmoricola sp.]